MDQYTEKSEQRSTRVEPVPSGSAQPDKSSELRSVLQIFLIATTGSTIIALYILWIGTSGHHKRNVDVAAQAALYAAKQLSQIYVDSRNFGKVGVCDNLGDDNESFSYAGTQIRVTGIDTIHRTLEVDGAVAKRLHKQVMADLISKDAQQATQIEAELSQRLHEAAEPDMMDAQTHDSGMQLYGANSQAKQNNIYRDVYRMLAADKSSPDQSLVEVRLKLGRYKKNAGLPSWPTGKIRLLDRSDLFEVCKSSEAPFAVLVEAVYQPRPKPGAETTTTITKKSCALIASPGLAPLPSTLVLNFPDGLPLTIDSAMSLVDSPLLKGAGDWQQVTGTEVPGKGSLAPTLQPVLPGMSPSDAFSIALYHWLRGLGPRVNAAKLVTLLATKWNGPEALRRFQAESTISTAEGARANSCLAVDSGARGYAILNQTGQGAVGQTAISNAFDITTGGLYGGSKAVSQPQNAIPLYVDENGVCNLPGRNGYDRALLDDYLKSIYDTNLAAIESAAVARMAIARATTELSQLDQKVFIERQELNSVENRMLRATHATKAASESEAPNAVAHQTDLANEEIESLKASIASHDEDRASLRKAALLGQRVVNNANQVAISTFDLSSHALKLCKDGINRIDKPTKAFILSRKVVFTPCTKSVDETDFFKNDAETSSASKVWMPRGFDVLTPVADAKLDGNKTIVESRSFQDFMASTPPLQRANASVVFLTSESLLDSANPKPVISNLYPFENIRLPSGQLFYYCRDALLTGTAPKVSWSVVIRDLVSTVGQNANGQQTGDPIQSDHLEWCKLIEQNSCPGLACEFQLRTPLPVVTNPPERSLTNPYNNAQVQQVPPVPADML